MGAKYFKFICFFLILQGCHAQDNNFQYKPLPESLQKKVKSGTTKIPNTAFDLTEGLPNNFVMDGSVDYTNYIQKSILLNRVVAFPDFPVLINRKGITIPDNTTIYFNSRSLIKLVPSASKKFEVLRLHGVKNVTIYSPRIIGDRKNHIGSEGEWGMGIAIRSSTNVKIYDALISECWGDGIYVGQIGNIPSENIKIFSPKLDYNRRNGISITSVKGLELINPLISNTNGTLPMGGIVIEPNSNNDEISDIIIRSAMTFNNKYGIVIGLGKLIGKRKHITDILIDSHNDEISQVAFFMGGSQSHEKRPGFPILGKVELKNPVWRNNTQHFKISKSFGRVPILALENLMIDDDLDSDVKQRNLKKELSNNQYIIVK